MNSVGKGRPAAGSIATAILKQKFKLYGLTMYLSRALLTTIDNREGGNAYRNIGRMLDTVA